MKLCLPRAPLALLALTACSDIDPVGTYETTPESLIRSIEETLPPKETTLGKLARERLDLAKAGAAQWAVTLQLAADKKFSLTMQLPIIPELRQAGTWSRNGRELDLQVTHELGTLLPQPKAVTGTIEANAITVQLPNGQRFMLQRQSG
jgi:hypothetical protein